MHALTRPRRALAALLAVLAVLACAAVLVVRAGSASAAPEVPALTGSRVLCGLYDGSFRLLDAPCRAHKDPTAPDGRSTWFVGPIPVPGAAGYQESIDAMIADYLARQAAKPTPTATASTTSAPDGAEAAPVIAANGAATATAARLKWSDARAGAGETIATYVVQYRVAGSTWGTAAGSPAAASPLTVGGLEANTGYEFRVRAEYASGADGPWSGVLAVRTAEVSALSS